MTVALSPWEIAARAFEPARRPWATPGELAPVLMPTRLTPALDLIYAALVDCFDTTDGRLIISMPPQEGKSTACVQVFPTWALAENPDLKVVTASYSDALARQNGRRIRDMIEAHPEKLGISVRHDLSAAGEWGIVGHDGGLLAVGIGSGLTGRPADLLAIDDPIKNQREANSAAYRDNLWTWWLTVGSTRLSPGASVVLVLTRWHEDDLAGRLIRGDDGDDWTHLNIPAQADHDPSEGETDVLGRDVGEYMASARVDKRSGQPRTPDQWDKIKRRSGSMVWGALYQGRPSPLEGDLLKREWWGEYGATDSEHGVPWVERDDGSRWVPFGGGVITEVVQSWDLAFKDLDTSDWVVGQVWLRRGADAFLLDQVRRRMGFVESCSVLVELSARWPQSVAKLVEDKANGPAVMNALARRVPGLIPVEPEGSKIARAHAVSPLIEAGNVYLPAPEIAPWIGDFLEEAAAFPNGANDDQVDAATQALNRILLHPLLAGEDLVEPEEFDEEAPITAF